MSRQYRKSKPETSQELVSDDIDSPPQGEQIRTGKFVGLDAGALDAVQEMIGDDPEFLRDLIQTYLETATQQVEELQQESVQLKSGEGDWGRIAMHAHSLKSSSGTLGATRLAGLFDRLELIARNHQPGNDRDIATYMAQIAEEFEQAKCALIELKANLTDKRTNG